MDIKQTLETLKAAGFKIEQCPRWRIHTAQRIAADGNGVRVWLFFGDRTEGGRHLMFVHTAAFPLTDGERLLNGAKKRDLEAGREVSSILNCDVYSIGCTLAQFNSGKLIKK